VRTYSYISPPPGREEEGFRFWFEPEAVAERAAELVDEGFTALKFDPFPLLAGAETHQEQAVPVQWSLEALDLAEEIVGAIRSRVGSRCDLMIGTHGQMTASSAIRFARRVERFSPLWFEEPVPPELPSEMAKVARATSIPITAGERLTAKWEFARLIRDEAASIFNPDVTQVGGLLEAKKIAALAEANGVQIAPHVYGGPFSCVAALQLALTLPNLLISEGIGRFTGGPRGAARRPDRLARRLRLPV
jgi:galactonate dehydratase